MTELSIGDETAVDEHIDTRTENGLVTELPQREEGETTIQYLDRLRDMNRFVFHGSPDSEIRVLEPKPSRAKPGSWQKDAAVFSSGGITMAVQRAIQGRKSERDSGRWFTSLGYGPKDHRPLMEISRNVKLGTGTVYVCSRIGFEASPNGGEFKSKQSVTPLGKVIVTPQDYTEGMGGKIIYTEPTGLA